MVKIFEIIFFISLFSCICIYFFNLLMFQSRHINILLSKYITMFKLWNQIGVASYGGPLLNYNSTNVSCLISCSRQSAVYSCRGAHGLHTKQAGQQQINSRRCKQIYRQADWGYWCQAEYRQYQVLTYLHYTCDTHAWTNPSFQITRVIYGLRRHIPQAAIWNSWTVLCW